MAYELNAVSVTLPASGNLSSNQYLLVSATTAEQAQLVTTRGGTVLGVQEGNSTAAGISTKINVGGFVKVWAGGSTEAAITAGTQLVSSTAGVAITYSTAGSYVIGRAVDTLSSESTGIITMHITHEGYRST